MRRILAVVALLALLCTAAAAITPSVKISGSTAFGAIGAITLNGTTLENSSLITLPQPPALLTGMYVSTGQGDFSAVPSLGTPPDITKLTFLTSSPMNLNNLTGWTFGSAAFGTWTTTSGTHTHPGTGFLNISLEGTFTPGTMFNGRTQSRGIATLSFNKSGGSTSFNGTFAMVPEPSSIVVLVGGLGTLLALRRRRV